MGVNTVKREHKSGKVTWHVRWYRSQLEPRVHLGSFDSEEEATIRRDVVRRMLAAGEYPTLAKLEFRGEGRFKDLAVAWLESRHDVGAKTKANSVTAARKCVNKFGPRDVRSITNLEIQEWISQLSAEGYARGTIKNIVKKGLGMILAYGVKLGWLPSNPVVGVTLPHGGKRVVEKLPTYAEWLKVREELRGVGVSGGRKGDAVLTFDLITHAGARISEATEVTWREVDDKRIVIGGKTYVMRNVSPLPYQPAWLPVKPEGANLDDRVCGMSAAQFRYQLNTACERAGVTKWDEKKQEFVAAINPHLMRKLCASLMHTKLAVPIADGGHGLSVVAMAERMGHTQEEFLKTYSTLIPPADWR